MATYHEINAQRRTRQVRLLGQAMNVLVAVLLTLVACSACSAMKESVLLKHSADITRCQNMDAGWADACQRMQQVQPSNSNIIKLNH